MRINDWLTMAEISVRRAANSPPTSESDLAEAVTYLQSALTGIPLDNEALGRLKALRQEVTALQAVARAGAALYFGLDQLEQAAVIGYTPTGLERAL
jgi:hypothetical protein